MFQVNEDLSIYATRGDIVFFSVMATDGDFTYEFQPGDIVRMAIYGKKNAENCVMQKDFPVVTATDSVFIFLEETDTKIGSSISKPTDYWYEIVLNPDIAPQTIIGYDFEEGARVFRLFPESEEIGDDYDPKPEDFPVVDSELSLTSNRPIENQAVARALVELSAKVAGTCVFYTDDTYLYTDENLTTKATKEDVAKMVRGGTPIIINYGGTRCMFATENDLNEASAKITTLFHGAVRSFYTKEAKDVRGTWVLVDDPDLTTIPTSTEVNFMSNGATYTNISRNTQGAASWGIYCMSYSHNSSDMVNAYTCNPSGSYSIAHGWKEEAYKTITISEFTNDKAFIEWLEANAVQEVTE